MNILGRLALGAVGVLALGSVAVSAVPSLTPTPIPRVESIVDVQESVSPVSVATPAFSPLIKAKPTPLTQTPAPLSNNNYYKNSAGNQVHAPAYSNTVPIGASAQCGDGTYSFSQSRRGTCSHHGGVARWL